MGELSSYLLLPLREDATLRRGSGDGRAPVLLATAKDTSLASLKEIYGTQGWILVTGVSSDKKAGEIVGALAPSFDTIICTTAHHKGAPADAIAAAAQNANPGATLHIAATIEDAVDISRTLATTQNRKIYVAGGLFLGIEYATVARGGSAQELKFF